MSKLINQRANSDCGIACMAMFADIPYEDALFWASNASGTPPTVLQEEGVPITVLESALRRITHSEVVTLAGKRVVTRPAILVVPSLNKEDQLHYIYEDGEGNCFDPQEGRKGEAYYSRTPSNIWAMAIQRVDCQAVYDLVRERHEELARVFYRRYDF